MCISIEAQNKEITKHIQRNKYSANKQQCPPAATNETIYKYCHDKFCFVYNL